MKNTHHRTEIFDAESRRLYTLAGPVPNQSAPARNWIRYYALRYRYMNHVVNLLARPDLQHYANEYLNEAIFHRENQ